MENQNNEIESKLGYSKDELNTTQKKSKNQSNEKDGSKKVKFMIDSRIVDEEMTERKGEIPEEEKLRVRPMDIQDEEINRLYESISTEMKSLQGQNVDDLKNKLETIRKNKILLESRIKEYELKLNR